MLKLLQSPLIYVATAGVAALVLLSTLGGETGAVGPRITGSSPRVVVVELFTSEGCSSCPPADTLLKELSEQQKMEDVQIVALEEHVDYWNHLGWRDPYSAAEFSERQNDYSHIFGTDGVYTPQMIVDGQNEIVGNRSLAAREALQKAAGQPKPEIELLPSGNAQPGKPPLQVRSTGLKGTPPHGATDLSLAVRQ